MENQDIAPRSRKLALVNTQQLTQQLKKAAQRSVYKLYSVIYTLDGAFLH